MELVRFWAQRSMTFMVKSAKNALFGRCFSKILYDEGSITEIFSTKNRGDCHIAEGYKLVASAINL
jgi:hypothetical protein